MKPLCVAENMLFTNLRMLYNGKLARDMAILVEEGRILEVGSSQEMKQRHGVSVYDCSGLLVMPGMVCAHTHTYSAFARGMKVSGDTTNFPNILKNLWWKLDSVLTPEAVEYSARVSFIEGIKHGTTTFFDHHASPGFIDGSLEAIAGVAKSLGIRANLSYEITDRYGDEKAREAIRENERTAMKGSEMLSGSIGLHASFTLSDETLAKVSEVKKRTSAGIHIHVAEDVVDQSRTMEMCGMNVVARLHKFELLDAKSICVHCIHLSGEEIDMLEKASASIVHCPESNMNNAVGYSNVPVMLSRHMPVCLGTDGFTHDMFAEAKCAYLLHKFASRNPTTMPAVDVFKLLENNTMLGSKFFGVKLGSISPGYAADFMLIDYKNYTHMHSQNFPWHFIFGMDASQVKTVVVNGSVILENGKITRVDEEKIMEQSIKISERIWEKFEAVNT